MFLVNRKRYSRTKPAWDDPFGQLTKLFDPDIFIPRFTVSTNIPGLSYRSKEEGDVLTLSVDVPGVKAADLTVTTNDASVTVVSTRDGRTNRETYYVDNGFDTSTAGALLQDGVLTLTFTRTSNGSSPKRVEVKTA